MLLGYTTKIKRRGGSFWALWRLKIYGTGRRELSEWYNEVAVDQTGWLR